MTLSYMLRILFCMLLKQNFFGRYDFACFECRVSKTLLVNINNAIDKIQIPNKILNMLI